MAARQGSTELSLHIVAGLFGNGPPVEPAAGNQSFGPDVMRAAEDEFADRLIELDNLWREHHVPPDRAYAALASIILPESRPAEVFLYAEPITGSSSGRAARNLRPVPGCALAAWVSGSPIGPSAPVEPTTSAAAPRLG